MINRQTCGEDLVAVARKKRKDASTPVATEAEEGSDLHFDDIRGLATFGRALMDGDQHLFDVTAQSRDFWIDNAQPLSEEKTFNYKTDIVEQVLSDGEMAGTAHRLRRGLALGDTALRQRLDKVSVEFGVDIAGLFPPILRRR